MARLLATFSQQRSLGVAAGALAIFLAHLPEFTHRLLDGDEAIYGTVANLMNLGGPLYGAGGVDNKPPGIFWIYSLIFRAFGNYQMTAVHAAGFIAMAGTCVLIYLIARDAHSHGAGFLAALFYGLLTATGNPRLLATNTELFMMLPLAGSVLLLLRRRWLWSGILLVAAGAFRQSAAVNVLLVAFAVVWLEPPRSRVRATEAFALGIVIAALAVVAVLALTGSPGGFFRWTIQTLTGYASSSWTPSLVWPRARDSVVPFVLDTVVLWIAAAAAVTRWRSSSPQARLMIVWLAVGMAGSLAGGHLSWHYFIQAMGPLAVVAAIGLASFNPRRSLALAAALGIIVPVVGWWIFDLSADPLTYDFSPPVPQHETVAAYVAAHTSPSDRVFIWGDWPAVYVESDRTMSSRFPGFLRGFARGSGLPPKNWDTAPDVWPLLRSDLTVHPPALILDTAAAGWSDFESYPMSDYPVLETIVTTQYHEVATVDGVVIYARNAGAP